MGEQTPTNEADQSEWDEQWIRICEMDTGTDDPFPEFADRVREAMEQAGNEVGRPLVMKVKIQVAEGELNRPVDSDTEQEQA